MKRINIERNYWQKNALDRNVDLKYISDIGKKECLEDIGKRKGKVLEIGCGVGRLMQDGDYGIDISENMLKIAKQRNPNLNLSVTDGRTIPHEDAYFNYVYCYLVFQHLHIDGVQSYIKEAYRVLKNGGVFTFQWIEGDEDEPFSKHLKLEVVDKMTNMFKEVKHKKSTAYTGWTITRCIK